MSRRTTRFDERLCVPFSLQARTSVGKHASTKHVCDRGGADWNGALRLRLRMIWLMLLLFPRVVPSLVVVRVCV